MATTGKYINVEQMIDLACGTPEAGVINFNALHAFLHIVAQQLRLDNFRIEFADGCKQMNRMISRLPAKPTFDIAKFSVRDTDAAGNYANRKPIRAATTAATTPVDTLLVVRRRNQKALTSPKPSKTSAMNANDGYHPSSEPMDTNGVLLDEQPPLATNGGYPLDEHPPLATDGSPLEPLAVPKTSDFRNLHVVGGEQPITDAIGELMPNSRQLIGSLGGGSNSISDMYDMLNLTKRLDATETTIKMLLQMLTEMGGEYNRVTERLHESSEQNVQMIKDIEQKLHQESSSYTTIVVQPPTPQPMVDLRELPDINGRELDKLRLDLDYIRIAVQRISQCSGLKDVAQFLAADLATAINCPGQPHIDLIPLQTAAGVDSASNYGNAHDEETVQKLQALERSQELMELRQATTEKRQYEMENEVAELSDRMAELLRNIEQQADQELDAAAMSAQLNDIRGTTVQNSERITTLMMTRDTMAMVTDELGKKLDRLDSVKCDRDEVDEWLAEKADYNLVQRKVSNDHFDATKRELGNGIGELLAKLADHEDGQQQQWVEIRDELKGRPTREDVDALRELLTTRLQAMQEKIRSMDVRRSDPEAAGTKTRFLRDVQCLSCEQSAVMRKEEPTQGVPKTAPMLAFKSLKPQLTYELDRMRKDMAQGAGGVGRNMHHFEKMYGSVASKAAGGGSALEKAHLCARYCGGSHTAISAHDRRAKMTHGPGSAPKRKADNLMQGADGSIYKAAAAEMEPCNCADTMPSRTLPPAAENVVKTVVANPTKETSVPNVVGENPAAAIEDSSKEVASNTVGADVSTASSVSFAPSSVLSKALPTVKASSHKTVSIGSTVPSMKSVESSSTQTASVTIAPIAGSFASDPITTSTDKFVDISRESSAPELPAETVETTVMLTVMPSTATSSNASDSGLMVNSTTTDVIFEPTEVMAQPASMAFESEVQKTATESVVLRESVAKVDLNRPDI